MNRMKKNVFLFLIIEFIVCILCLIIDNIDCKVYFSLIELLIGYYIIKLNNGKWITFTTVFMTLSYILHMGNLVATVIWSYNNDYILMESSESINAAISFFILCHFMLLAGSISCSHKSSLFKIERFTQIDRRALFQTGFFCTAIGIIPRIYIDYQQIMLQINGNYLETLGQIQSYGWLSIVAQFFYVGIIILLFTSDKHIWRGRIILVSVSLWEAITMLSGGRIYAISFIVVLAYIYCIRIEMPNIKQTIIVLIIIYILCMIMTTISQIRVSGSFSLEALKNAVLNATGKDNPILKILVELGGTMKTLIYSIINFPSYCNFGFGSSYYDSVLSVIPFYENNIADVNHMVFIYNFKFNDYLGGSWIGEAYYNFSWIGIFYCFIIGKITGRFERTFIKNENKDNYIETLCVLTFLFYLILYIRDYFYRFTVPIQVCIVVIFIGMFLKKHPIRIK